MRHCLERAIASVVLPIPLMHVPHGGLRICHQQSTCLEALWCEISHVTPCNEGWTKPSQPTVWTPIK